MLKKEEDFLKSYIDKLVAKNFARLVEIGKVTISYGVLFALKKDGELRPYINYRPINTKTIKDYDLIPL